MSSSGVNECKQTQKDSVEYLTQTYTIGYEDPSENHFLLVKLQGVICYTSLCYLRNISLKISEIGFTYIEILIIFNNYHVLLVNSREEKASRDVASPLSVWTNIQRFSTSQKIKSFRIFFRIQFHCGLPQHIDYQRIQSIKKLNSLLESKIPYNMGEL